MRFSMPRIRAFPVLLTEENTRTMNAGGMWTWLKRSVFFPCRRGIYGRRFRFQSHPVSRNSGRSGVADALAGPTRKLSFEIDKRFFFVKKVRETEALSFCP